MPRSPQTVGITLLRLPRRCCSVAAKALLVGLPFIMVTACSTTQSSSPQVVHSKGYLEMAWTPEDLHQDTATRLVSKTSDSTHLLLTTVVSEKPHVHDQSDLTVTLQSGTAVIHIDNKAYAIQEGDVIHIARGTPHWLELLNGSRLNAYVIFTPAFDPSDRRFVEAK